ncbi:30S ribosome-binding factor RbfA [Paracrocinitomix mangrovi]|uniref:30S ribosome-binding factor RbfA n=1 Tax=Paracrocinitomix mangrovi TaxID=2862509 RepID=UPI001C8DF6CF|nr:30S ribosome-binding factor RbfA [Paracrocinitomix mangrovi]UKN03365.1 30S ribosome-binding factor RbfA [Paracrocinitomix mangrovi]
MSIRLKKIESVLQQELSSIFRERARDLCKGAMVSVTVVKVAPDLSFAKVYISIFGGADNKETFESINAGKAEVRYELGKRLGKTMRRIPELSFEIDDSLDYAEEIDRLLKE